MVTCDQCGKEYQSGRGLEVHVGRMHKKQDLGNGFTLDEASDGPDIISAATDIIGKSKSAHKLSVTAQDLLSKLLTMGLVYGTIKLAIEPTPDQKELTEDEKKRLTPNREARKALFAPMMYVLEMSSPVTKGINELASHSDIITSIAAWMAYSKNVASVRASHQQTESRPF